MLDEVLIDDLDRVYLPLANHFGGAPIPIFHLQVIGISSRGAGAGTRLLSAR